MALRVIRPGLLATLQASARSGLRHQGIPASGPADALSMALANRLVDNALEAPAIEITLGGAAFEFYQDTAFAFTGASVEADLSGETIPAHQTCHAKAGSVLSFPRPAAGVRTYLAIAGGFSAAEAFGSASTCIPAGFGGHEGRALVAGDSLPARATGRATPETLFTPPSMRPRMAHTHSLRAVPGPDSDGAGAGVWSDVFLATQRMDRTGIEVSGPWPRPELASTKPSAALFPGAVQLTPSGNAFILLPDAQTTGGYPHVLQIIRADRHLLGQIAPGDRIQFLRRSVDAAFDDLKAKAGYFADWLPGFQF